MYLHGKGLQIKNDLANGVKEGNFDSFKAKYGQDLLNLLFDNFVRPLMSEKDPKKQQAISNKLSLFCAAFVSEV